MEKNGISSSAPQVTVGLSGVSTPAFFLSRLTLSAAKQDICVFVIVGLAVRAWSVLNQPRYTVDTHEEDISVVYGNVSEYPQSVEQTNTPPPIENRRCFHTP